MISSMTCVQDELCHAAGKQNTFSTVILFLHLDDWGQAGIVVLGAVLLSFFSISLWICDLDVQHLKPQTKKKFQKNNNKSEIRRRMYTWSRKIHQFIVGKDAD